MEFRKVMKERYAHKKFDGRPVETSQLHVTPETGRLASAAKNLQERHIYVAQSEEALVKLDNAIPYRYGVVAVAVVTFDKNNIFTYPDKKRGFGVGGTSIVATHMMLAAKAEGADSCWTNFFDLEGTAKELGPSESEEVLMLLDLGYVVKGTKPLAARNQRREVSETVSYM